MRSGEPLRDHIKDNRYYIINYYEQHYTKNINQILFYVIRNNRESDYPKYEREKSGEYGGYTTIR